MPDVGLPTEKSLALETLDLCVEFRGWRVSRAGAVKAAARRLAARAVEELPAPPVVILVAVVAALSPPKRRDAAAGLTAEEYKRRYELGRQQYQEERAARKTRQRAWRREHGPWLLLAVIAGLLILFLGVTQPQPFIVVTTLVLYTGLAWVVCWVIRASC
jgi:Flp pilus assembly protein TadB